MPQSSSMRQMLAEHMLAPKDGHWGSSGSGRKERTSPVMASTQQIFTAPISLLASGTWGLGRAQSLWCQISGAIKAPRTTAHFSSSFQSLPSWLSWQVFQSVFPTCLRVRRPSRLKKAQSTTQRGGPSEHSLVDPA